jgi:hypothetical protein
MASCCAIGRSSVEATNASLMRAVRARRAALVFGLTGLAVFFPAALLVRPKVSDGSLIVALVLLLAGFAASRLTVLPAWLAGLAVLLVPGAGFFACCAVFFAGFLAVVFAWEEAAPAGLADELPPAWPATGNATINHDSTKARQKNARHET